MGFNFGDLLFGEPAKNEEKPLPQPVVPFLTGLGPNPGMSWAPQYQQAYTYNPYAFLGGDPYGTGQTYPWSNPYRMDQDAWAQQQQINAGYYNPTQQPQQPGQPPGQQQLPGGQPFPTLPGAPQFGPGSQITTGQPTNSYQAQYNNGIYSGAEGNVPGLFPSAANQAMYGPAEYYPWLDVAGKTLDQQNADNQLRSFVENGGQDLLGDVRGIANQLTQGNYLSNPVQARTSQYARDLMNDGLGQDVMDASQGLMGAGDRAARYANRAAQDPSFQKDFGKYGLGRYTQDYAENPFLTNVIDDASNDAIRNTMEYQLRQDREGAIQAGQYGGARSGIAEGMTGRGLAEELGQLATQTRFGDYNNWQDRGLRAGESLMQGDISAQNAATQRAQIESNHRLGLLSALTNMATGGANMYGIGADAALGAGNLGNQSAQQALNLDSLRQTGMESGANLLQDVIDGKLDLNDALRNIGTRDQTLNQLFLNSDKNRWNFGQQAPWDVLGQWSQILGIGNQAQNTRQDSDAGGMGVVDGLTALSGLGGLAGIAGLFSDVRLKENIEPIGTVNVIPWYRWTWNEAANALGLRGESQGVIAQEVQRIAPHLIGARNGYLTVNYAGIL